MGSGELDGGVEVGGRGWEVEVGGFGVGGIGVGKVGVGGGVGEVGVGRVEVGISGG